MNRTGTVVRILIALLFAISLAAPFATIGVTADDKTDQDVDPTGILEVVLVDQQTGQRLAGACWNVVDARQVGSQYCDFDGDGVQDMLLRLDWRTRDAFGRGVDLLQITRRSAGGATELNWRLSAAP